MDGVENGDKAINESHQHIKKSSTADNTRSPAPTKQNIASGNIPLPTPGTSACPSSVKGARPKDLGSLPTQSSADVGNVLNTLCLNTEGTSIMNGDVREEKIKKWKQAGTALRRALSRITKSKSHKKSYGRGEKHKSHDKVTKVKHGSSSSSSSSGGAHKSPSAKACKKMGSGKALKKDDSLVSIEENTITPVNSPGDPMNQMLEEFQMTAQPGIGVAASVHSKTPALEGAAADNSLRLQGAQSTESAVPSGRQLPSFAELKEKIKRMTSGSNGSSKVAEKSSGGNVTKKRHKILRHSKSQDGNDKANSQSSESEIEDFQTQKHYKPSARHAFKEKRKSIDNAALSLLKCGLGPGLTQVGEDASTKSSPKKSKEIHSDSLPDLLSDSSLSDGEVPLAASLGDKGGTSQDHKLECADIKKVMPISQGSKASDMGKQRKVNLPMSRATQALREAESFANLADVESCNSEPEGNSSDGGGEVDVIRHTAVDRELTPTRLNQRMTDARSEKGESDVSIPTLCSTSEEEEAAAGQIRLEKYQGKAGTTSTSSARGRDIKKNRGGWDVGADGEMMCFVSIQIFV